MASSIIGGLVANGFPPANISVSDPIAENRERLAGDFGIATAADNNAICAAADLIVLAVKPQVMKGVAQGISGALDHRPVVVSIAAGIPLAALESWLGTDKVLVRTMPNTPALVHRGATGMFANDNVSNVQKTAVEQLFSAVGISVWLDSEDDLDAVTALSGSGPAYFFFLMEAMQKEAIALGLNASTARRLTVQTALGAATMAAESDVDSAELRRRVTSPGGTTEQAILRFSEGGLPGLVTAAMTAARDRAREMAEEFK